MHVILRHLARCAVLVFALVSVSSTALASPPETPPGLETAPGQEKQAEQAATPAATPPPATGQSVAPGQEKQQATTAGASNGHAKQVAKASGSTSGQGIHSTNAGVKPANNTTHHTSCTTGGSATSVTCMPAAGQVASQGATSDRSKRYGNGMTAAQIAVSRGGVNVVIKGPGNSQPHKVCGKNGNWVDVHAVKAYAGLGSCATTQGGSTQSQSATNVQSSGQIFTPSFVATTAAGMAAQHAAASAAGVAGAFGAAAKPEANAAGGVAGALAEIGAVAGGTLPFTGFPLWAIAAVGIAAILLGLALRRGRATASHAVV